MKTKNNKIIFKSITKEEAKNLYCKCRVIYVKYNNEMRKIRESGEYGSHAPIEVLFYRSIGYYKDLDFYTEWSPEWKVVEEGNDKNGKPTIWSMDLRGTELEEDYGKFLHITLQPNGKYHLEFTTPYDEHCLKTCKTLASAKRWVTMYIL